MSARGPVLCMAKPVGPVCNLDCGYCYYLGTSALFPADERYRMRPEVLEAFVASVIRTHSGPVVPFVWHGGEPTLAGLDFFRRVVELEERYLPGGWRALNNLQTNGTLLDDAWGAFLAAHHFTVGISIDGPAHLHDAGRADRRARPSHERAIRGLRVLRRHGIEPDVLCTLNAANIAHPTEVYRFFLDEDVRWLQFLPVVKRRADGSIDPLSVRGEEMGEFLSRVFDEWVRHDIGRIAVQNFLECLLVVSGQPANICIMAPSCGEVLAVEHDGSVYACDHFVDADHRLGNLVETDLSELLDAPALARFGQKKRDALPAYCRDCTVRPLCNGGCPKDRFAATPDGETGLNYLCAGYRRFYAHTLPRLERTSALAAAGRPDAALMAELEVEEAEERRLWRATSRNAPCPCGSGAKYKHCCLATRR